MALLLLPLLLLLLLLLLLPPLLALLLLLLPPPLLLLLLLSVPLEVSGAPVERDDSTSDRKRARTADVTRAVTVACASERVQMCEFVCECVNV